MVSKPKNKLLRLEAMRGFAAFYVVLHHTIDFKYVVLGADLGQLFRFGQEAVILFFLISGFVINYSFQHSTDRSFSSYFLKRSIRIYVPLLVVFAVGYLTESYNAGHWIAADIQKFVLNILMLQDWDFAKPNVIVAPLLNNDPLWSLSYEWWFYMLFFVVVTLVPSRMRQTTCIFIVSMIASILYTVYPNFLFRLLAYLSIWWTGVHLSNIYMDKRAVSIRDCIPIVLVLGFICAVFLLNVVFAARGGESLLLGTHPILELRHFGFALTAVVLAALWQGYNWRFFDLMFGPFLIFAPISYVVYISHYHLFSSATYLSFIKQPVVEWFAYLAVVIVFSWWLEIKFYTLVKNRIYSIVRPRAHTPRLPGS